MSQITLYAAADAYMDARTPDTNFELWSIDMDVYYLSGDKTEDRRTIINFDCTLSGWTDLTAATLRLYVNTSFASAAATMYRCTRPSQWTETGVTWNKYDGTNAWTTAGGDYDGSTPTPKAFTFPASLGWMELDMLAFVNDARANRGGIFSVIAKLDNENPGSSVGGGWDSRTGTYPPELVITGTAPPTGGQRRRTTIVG